MSTKKKNPDTDWDFLGLASLGITAFGAAVFYLTGWIYESHWYGYFGIDVNLLPLQPQVYMARGFAGVALTLLVAMLITVPLLCWTKKPLDQSLKNVIRFVPVCVGIILLVVRAFLDIVKPDEIPITIDAWLLAIALFFLSLIIAFAPSRNHDQEQENCSNSKTRPEKGAPKPNDSEDSRWKRSLYNLLVLCYVAIFFVLSSITVSATLGEYVARSGVSILPQIDRNLPVTLITESELPNLKYEEKSMDTYRYEKLLLITITENGCYFLEGDRKSEFVVHIVPKEIIRQLIIGQ